MEKVKSKRSVEERAESFYNKLLKELEEGYDGIQRAATTLRRFHKVLGKAKKNVQR